MAIILVSLSALITALSNLLIRKGLDHVKGASGDPFILHRFIVAACVMLPIIYFRQEGFVFDSRMILVGVTGGLALGLLQYAMGRSLHYGPAALSIIFVASACVVPPIIMYFLFGEAFGHGYTLFHLLGALLVVVGLFWMGKSQDEGYTKDIKKWSFWIVAAFVGGSLQQLVLQWRALLLKEDLPGHVLLPFHLDGAGGDIYIPVAFATASLCQLFFHTPSSHKITPKLLLICGLFGGLLSGFSSYFLMLATEAAITDTEKAIIFPVNTVLLITLCNAWAYLLYKEKINWPANGLSVAGIIVSQKG